MYRLILTFLLIAISVVGCNNDSQTSEIEDSSKNTNISDTTSSSDDDQSDKVPPITGNVDALVGDWAVIAINNDLNVLTPSFEEDMTRLNFNEDSSVKMGDFSTTYKFIDETTVSFDVDDSTYSLQMSEENFGTFSAEGEEYAVIRTSEVDPVIDLSVQSMTTPLFNSYWVSTQNSEVYEMFKVDNIPMVRKHTYSVSQDGEVSLSTVPEDIYFYINDTYEEYEGFIAELQNLDGSTPDLYYRYIPNQYEGTIVVDDNAHTYASDNLDDLEFYLKTNISPRDAEIFISLIDFSYTDLEESAEIEQTFSGSFADSYSHETLVVVGSEDVVDEKIYAVFSGFSDELIGSINVWGDEIKTDILPMEYGYLAILTTKKVNDIYSENAMYSVDVLDLKQGEFTRAIDNYIIDSTKTGFTYENIYEDGILTTYQYDSEGTEKALFSMLWDETLSRFIPNDLFEFVQKGVTRSEADFLTPEQWNIFDQLTNRCHFFAPQNFWVEELATEEYEQIFHYEDYYVEHKGVSFEDYYNKMLEMMTLDLFEEASNLNGEYPSVKDVDGTLYTHLASNDSHYTEYVHETYELVELTEDTVRFNMVLYSANWDIEDGSGDSYMPSEEKTPNAFSSYPFTMVKTEQGWRFSEFDMPYDYYNAD